MSKLRIHYYLPLQASFEEARKSPLASIRLRAAPSIAGLLDRGHTVTFGSHCPNTQELDIGIFGKLGSPDEVPQREIFWTNEINALKNAGTKVVIDYSDHHLGVASNQTKFYEKNIALADLVCVPSLKMGELVRPFSRTSVAHISDAIEFDVLAPRKLNQTPRRLFWFGAKSNLKYLFSFIENLKYGDPLILSVLTDAKGVSIFQSSLLTSQTKLHVDLGLWSLEKMVDTALKSDLCIIPSDPSDIRKSGVGINRLITALALGLPVAASHICSYSEFSRYFVDIKENGLYSMIENPHLFHDDVSLAQRDIVNQFTMREIGSKWADLIEQHV